MSRSRQSAKQAGARFERLISDHLAAKLDDRIDRTVRGGAKDRGDIGGVSLPNGHRVVIECKDYGGQLKPGPWIKEAHIEAQNDEAALGVVIAKRRGVTSPGQQFVLMTVDDLIKLLTTPNQKAPPRREAGKQ